MSHLYKYLPPERNTYLSDGLLRFTPPSALNDPYEFLPGMSEETEKLALQQLEKNTREFPENIFGLSRNQRRIEKKKHEKKAARALSQLKRNPDIISEYIYNRAKNKMNNNLGIFSLSKRWDSALMWSHYTESHQGFCIGFKENHEYFKDINSPPNFGNFIIEPVIYSKDRPILPFLKPNFSENLKFILTKSKDWEYEQEVRVISLLEKATKTIECNPFNLSLFHVPHDAIGEIIIGLRSTEFLYNSAIELSKKMNIPMYKANLSKKTFDLERDLINS